MLVVKETLFYLVLFAVSINAATKERFFGGGQNWYNFRIGFTPNPFDGFIGHPRTKAEAIDAGWQQISNDCSEGASFPGDRYALENENGPNMVLIYDVNGFIAGMHSVVLKKYSSGNWQSDSPWYRSDNIFGEDAYLTTAYFVNPDVICSTGRTQSEFDVEGTGNTLLFLKEQDLIAVPLDVDSTDGSGWYKHFCLFNMGRHYFQLNHDTSASCDENLVPIQLMYSSGVLNGFVWQHIATIPGNLWETPGEKGVEAIVDRPPDCFWDLVKSPGVTTMHVYLKDYKTLCIFD